MPNPKEFNISKIQSYYFTPEFIKRLVQEKKLVIDIKDISQLERYKQLLFIPLDDVIIYEKYANILDRFSDRYNRSTFKLFNGYLLLGLIVLRSQLFDYFPYGECFPIESFSQVQTLLDIMDFTPANQSLSLREILDKQKIETLIALAPIQIVDSQKKIIETTKCIDFLDIQFYYLDHEIISALKNPNEANIKSDPNSVLVAFFEDEKAQKPYSDALKFRANKFLKVAKEKFPDASLTLGADSIYRTACHTKTKLYTIFVHRAFFEACYPRAPQFKAIGELRSKIIGNLDVNLKGQKNKLKKSNFDSKLRTMLRKMIFNLPDFGSIFASTNNNNNNNIAKIESVPVSAEVVQLGIWPSVLQTPSFVTKSDDGMKMIDLSEDPEILHATNLKITAVIDLIEKENPMKEAPIYSKANSSMGEDNLNDSSSDEGANILAEISRKRSLPFEEIPSFKKLKNDKEVEKKENMLQQIIKSADADQYNENALIKAIQQSHYKVINAMTKLFLQHPIHKGFVKLIKTSVDRNNTKILGVAIAAGDSVILNLVLDMCKNAGITDPAATLKAQYQLNLIFSAMPLEDAAQVLYGLCKIGFFKEPAMRQKIATILVSREDFQDISRKDIKQDLKIPPTMFFKLSPDEKQAKRDYTELLSAISKLLPIQSVKVNEAPVLTQ